MKIVINVCYGGFEISDSAVVRYAELKGIKIYPENDSFGRINYFTVPPEVYHETRKMCDTKPEGRGRYAEINGMFFSYYDIERTDPILIQVVEELGEGSWGSCAELKVVEIPDDVKWKIDEYDGMESIHEVHRTWG